MPRPVKGLMPGGGVMHFLADQEIFFMAPSQNELEAIFARSLSSSPPTPYANLTVTCRGESHLEAIWKNPQYPPSHLLESTSLGWVLIPSPSRDFAVPKNSLFGIPVVSAGAIFYSR